MKASIFLILLVSSICSAKSAELIVGGLTYHTFVADKPASHFTHKLSADGKFIYNHMYGFGYIDSTDIFYSSHKFFIGQNSIGEPMGGYLYSFGGHFDSWDVGFGFGGYYQNNNRFKDKGIYVANIAGIVPLLGLEFNKKMMIDRTKYVKVDTFFTLLTITSCLAIGEDF